jgi:hypothetical protein
VIETSHRDGDPDKTKEEYDDDNHADQENPNNEEYDKDGTMLFRDTVKLFVIYSDLQNINYK